MRRLGKRLKLMGSNTRNAIDIVLSYREKIKNLERISYAKWAVDEIAKILVEEKQAPLLAIEEFRDKVDLYSKQNVYGRRPFIVAKDVAEQIIDELIKS